MALELNLDLGNGIPPVSNAYVRVARAGIVMKGLAQVSADKPAERARIASIEVHFFADREHSEAGNALRSPEFREFVYKGGDIDAEAYAHLKSLPEYSGAKDV